MDQTIIREIAIVIGICILSTILVYLIFRRLWGRGLIVSWIVALATVINVTCIVAFTVGRVGVSWTTVIIGASVVATINVVITVIMKRSVIDTIQNISAVASAMAAGDANLSISTTAPHELGQLSRSIQQLIDYHDELADLALRMAEGDLSMDVRSRSRNDSLSHSFTWMLESQRGLIGRMNQSVLDVTRSSQQVLSASEQSNIATQQIRGTIGQVAQSTSLQTEYIGQIRDLIELQVGSVETIAQGAHHQSDAVAAAENVLSNQVDVAMHQVSESLQASHQAAYGAGAVAQQGAAAVDKTIDRIRATAAAMEQVSQRVVEMGHRSQQIVAIVQTIDEIAERTNLLALNAAIEAARAGEQGRGFAVVADEVRKLAERSAKSTKEISGLIEAVQETASQAVEAMQGSNREMEQGLATADETQNSLGQIQQAVAEVETRMVGLGNAVDAITNGNQTLLGVMTRVSAIGEENTRASSGLAEGSDGLLQAIEELSAIAEENSAAAEQVASSTADVGSHDQLAASSAHELITMATGLRELVGQFVLKQADNGDADNGDVDNNDADNGDADNGAVPEPLPDALTAFASTDEWHRPATLAIAHPPIAVNDHHINSHHINSHHNSNGNGVHPAGKG